MGRTNSSSTLAARAGTLRPQCPNLQPALLQVQIANFSLSLLCDAAKTMSTARLDDLQCSAARATIAKVAEE